MKQQIDRYIEIAHLNVKNLNLNLKGLTVLTECASKAYGFLPFVAALAGADVHALGRDSGYGTFDENRLFIKDLLRRKSLESKVSFYDRVIPDQLLSKVDILTNSGFLRPITSEMINKLNRTAVIPLMWETWELRDGEIDMEACQKALIPVIGTNEHFKQADMFAYPGMLALKMLFEAGLEVANNKFVLLGGGLTGSLIAETLRNNGIAFSWFGNDANNKSMKPYSDIRSILESDRLDALLVADHVYEKQIIGKSSPITFSEIKEKFPFVKLCHLCGNIDVNEMKESGIFFYPETIKAFGYMSYETINLGWEPVIMLGAAGLKVGELAARARLSGKSIEGAIAETVEYGIGMDFEGGFLNFKKA